MGMTEKEILAHKLLVHDVNRLSGKVSNLESVVSRLSDQLQLNRNLKMDGNKINKEEK